MAKLSGWLITIIGLLLVLALIIPDTFSGMWFNWVIALLVLVFGVSKLIRSYTYKKRR